LTMTDLSPPYLAKMISAIERTIKKVQKEESTAKDAKPVKQPAVGVVVGIVERNRLVGVDEIAQIGKLGDLDALRSQLVGLLEVNSRNLVGVLAQAGGGGLVRTLQGLEVDLKAKEGSA
ncbi:hypothetical protein P7C73_g3071, partial [Tremellales sp. Uapishka_1]